MKYAEGIGNDSRLTEGTRLSGCLILEFLSLSRGLVGFCVSCRILFLLPESKSLLLRSVL
jgi:hypothetical protein